MKKLAILLCMHSLIYAQTQAPGTPIWNIAANVKQRACIIESKICNLDIDFSGSFTVINDIIENECTISSQLDDLENILINFDFAGTFTALAKTLELACAIDSELDSPNSIVDVIQSSIGFAITNELVGTSGLTITEGGEYYLAENIVFEPSSTGLAAITIDADNTFIDFKNKTLSTDGTGDTIGVELISSHTNVELRNGVISETTAQGILLNTSSAEISIKNMTIKNTNADSGLEISMSCTNLFISNLAAVNCGNHGILANDSSLIILQNCSFNDNSLSGASFTDCNLINLSGCVANNNSDQGLSFSSSTTSSNISLNDCMTLDNGEHGILFEHLTNSIISNGFSKGNTLDGIHLIDTSNTSIMNNCCENNGRDNIRLATDATGTQHCYVGQNSLVLTTSVNLREESGSFENGIFGNFALADSSSNNYVSIGGGSFINTSLVSQEGDFSATEPTFWNNISMTTS